MSMFDFLTDDDYKTIDDIVNETIGNIDENPKLQLFYADIFKSAIDSGEEFAIDLFHHFNFDLIRENVLVYIVSKYDEENPIQFIKIAELANETQSSDFIISMFKECIFIFEELLKSENIEVLPPVFSVLTKVFQNCPECSVILGEVISITEIDEILFNQLKNNEICEEGSAFLEEFIMSYKKFEKIHNRDINNLIELHDIASSIEDTSTKFMLTIRTILAKFMFKSKLYKEFEPIFHLIMDLVKAGENEYLLCFMQCFSHIIISPFFKPTFDEMEIIFSYLENDDDPYVSILSWKCLYKAISFKFEFIPLDSFMRQILEPSNYQILPAKAKLYYNAIFISIVEKLDSVNINELPMGWFFDIVENSFLIANDYLYSTINVFNVLFKLYDNTDTPQDFINYIQDSPIIQEEMDENMETLLTHANDESFFAPLIKTN